MLVFLWLTPKYSFQTLTWPNHFIMPLAGSKFAFCLLPFLTFVSTTSRHHWNSFNIMWLDIHIQKWSNNKPWRVRICRWSWTLFLATETLPSSDQHLWLLSLLVSVNAGTPEQILMFLGSDVPHQNFYHLIWFYWELQVHIFLPSSRGTSFFDFWMEIPRQKPDYEPLQSANFSFHGNQLGLGGLNFGQAFRKPLPE